jgi:hypothetical protein
MDKAIKVGALVEPKTATCACCGAEWTPSKEDPRVSNILVGGGENGAPLMRDFHKRCYDFIRAEIDKALKHERVRVALADQSKKPLSET